MKICFEENSIVGYNSIIAMLLSYKSNIFRIKKNIEENDVIGVSYFNIDSLVIIKRLRKKYPKNKIIVGGIGVYQDYVLLLRYVDYVYMGDAFNFDESCIIDKDSVKKTISVNNHTPFAKLPLIRHANKRYELLTEKGCPNKCEFCLISHVNDYKIIDKRDFRKKINFIEKKMKGCIISFVSSDGITNIKNKDILLNSRNNKYYCASLPLKTFLKNYDSFGSQNNIKFGIELPTEELRFKKLPNIKKITNKELIECVEKKHCNFTSFFMLYNYFDVTNSDYGELYDIARYKKDNLNLRFSFTTLEVAAYTPIAKDLKRHCEQLIEYDDFQDVEEIKRLKKHISHVRVFPGKMNKNVLYRYFMSFLPFDYKIIKPDSFKNAILYYDGMRKINQDNNLTDLMQNRINKMTKQGNKITLISLEN